MPKICIPDAAVITGYRDLCQDLHADLWPDAIFTSLLTSVEKLLRSRSEAVLFF